VDEGTVTEALLGAKAGRPTVPVMRVLRRVRCGWGAGVAFFRGGLLLAGRAKLQYHNPRSKHDL
jgi:hypothetical protein